MPLAASRYPPVLDLPQLLTQIDELARWAADPGGELRVQLAAPNKIAYPLLALAHLAPERWTPRAALLLVSGAFVAGVFALARRRGRAPAQAALATLFLWSGSFYAGFLHFVLGAPLFGLWLDELTSTASRRSRRQAIGTAVAALALYFAHVLWLAAGALATALVLAARRAPRREWAARGAGLLPAAALAALWYPSLARGGWSSQPLWGASPGARLASFDYWQTALLGGLAGPFETALVGALALALLAAAWRARGEGGWDQPFVAAAVAFGVALFALPEVVGPTALFARRWGFAAGLCLLLAAPAAGLRGRAATATAAALLVAWSAVTVSAWRGFARERTTGFAQALAAVRPGDRLLGLDYLRGFERLRLPATFHFAAYAACARGARVATTFADTPSSLVVHRALPRAVAWYPFLDQQPERVGARDLAAFDVVLVHAAPDRRRAFEARFPALRPVAGEATWRLYRVAPPAPAAGSAP